MQILETPAHHFDGLVDYPFAPNFVPVDPSGARMHYVDEGPKDGALMLLLHGEPSWSYLYRFMIPPLAAAGFRVVAPDLIGFGKSSKPTKIGDHSYATHVRWMGAFLDALHLKDITLFAQDWGSLIGLRIVGEQPERFARVAIGNGFLPVGSAPSLNVKALQSSAVFFAWRTFATYSPWFPISKVLNVGTARELSREERRAYDAPFPERRYMAGARAMPGLVPTAPSDPARKANLQAWKGLERFERPFLTLFSTGDPITHGMDRKLQRRIPGAAGMPHDRVRGGHFLQEDSGPELAKRLIEFAG
ncbi:MAG: haloalkane dehalogenase [Myxococcota bacterium]